MPPTLPLEVALQLLLQAHRFATELGREGWDFAVEIASLRAAGLTTNDIRWLLYQDYLVQAVETTRDDDDRRSFRPTGRLALAEASCFLLTPAGVIYAESRLPNSPPVLSAPPHPVPPPASSAFPCWDKDRRTLRFGPLVVKQFKVPAPNQEIILAAFEEENWTARIDDPLVPHPAIDSKRRLHDTINSLNRNQKNPLLRFLGDGNGEGICWERSHPPALNGARHAPNGSNHFADADVTQGAPGSDE